jgi:rare lipoprotein A
MRDVKTMRHRFTFAVIALIFSLNAAQAFGPKRYHEGETQRGLASWYGPEQQGHLTADGERFDEHEFTAAHRHLPFGTIVRVTNRSNGLSVDVRINDRGPFDDDDRIIDVSSAAANVLQMKKAGVVPVEIEVIRLGSPGRANQG